MNSDLGVIGAFILGSSLTLLTCLIVFGGAVTESNNKLKNVKYKIAERFFIKLR